MQTKIKEWFKKLGIWALIGFMALFILVMFCLFLWVLWTTIGTWLYHNGISGIWEIILKFFSAVWHGAE